MMDHKRWTHMFCCRHTHIHTHTVLQGCGEMDRLQLPPSRDQEMRAREWGDIRRDELVGKKWMMKQTKWNKHMLFFGWGGERGKTPVTNNDWCVKRTPTFPGEKEQGRVEQKLILSVLGVLDNDWTGGAQTVRWLLRHRWRLVQQRPMQISWHGDESIHIQSDVSAICCLVFAGLVNWMTTTHNIHHSSVLSFL